MHAATCITMPALAAGIIIGLIEAGCTAPVTPDHQESLTLAYEHDTGIIPTRIASCMDDNPNPGAGCQ